VRRAWITPMRSCSATTDRIKQRGQITTTN